MIDGRHCAVVLAAALIGATAALAQAGGQGTNDGPGAQFQRKLDGGPGFVCSATNAMRDKQCSTSCPSRETADCIDAEGGDIPTCRCTKG